MQQVRFNLLKSKAPSVSMERVNSLLCNKFNFRPFGYIQTRHQLQSSIQSFPIRYMSSLQRFESQDNKKINRIDKQSKSLDFFYHPINRIYHGNNQGPPIVVPPEIEEPKTEPNNESEKDYGGAICFAIQTALVVTLVKGDFEPDGTKQKLFGILFTLFPVFFYFLYPKIFGIWLLCLLSMDSQYGFGQFFW
jgi:hypothetical protein